MEHAAREAPAEPGAVDRIEARINRSVDRIDRLVGDSNSGSVAQAIASAPQPAAPWHVWVCVGAAWLGTLLAVYAVAKAGAAADRMADLRTDMRAAETRAAIMDRWIAQEITAVRSYITTGKLAPMNPPPLGTTEEKPK